MAISSFRNEHHFLSNFHPCSNGVKYEGIIYPTSEHAFQAAKSLDPAERELVRLQSSPGKAKRISRINTLRPGWEEIKVSVMKKIVKNKFKRNEALREKLINTGKKNLIEGNTWGDTFWGVCGGEGSNVLGIILMEVREELRKAKGHTPMVDLR